jgi:hypothetical protein
MRLGADAGGVPQGSAAPAQQAADAMALALADADIMVHVQRNGDLPGKIGEWAGIRGSRQWIEGFSLTPRDGIKAVDIEYQAVLGRGWLSPWIEGSKFCGSRGMALPLLGLKIRLKGAAAKSFDCTYSATFVDGSMIGPISAGETCEAQSLAALEAFQVVIQPRDAKSGTARPVITKKISPATPPPIGMKPDASKGRSPLAKPSVRTRS